MVWYGDILNSQDKVVNALSNQTDLASTLLRQLNINSDEYIFSNDIFSMNSASQVTYAINNDFGYVSDSLEFIYNRLPDKHILINGTMSDSALMQAKAYYQLLYEDLLRR